MRFGAASLMKVATASSLPVSPSRCSIWFARAAVVGDGGGGLGLGGGGLGAEKVAAGGGHWSEGPSEEICDLQQRTLPGTLAKWGL